MTSKTDLKKWLYEYLTEEFGKEFIGLINPPHDVENGERVLYKLKHNTQAQRKEITQKDQDDFRNLLEDIAQKSGGTVAKIEPVVSSGLPYPRLIDIPQWSALAYQKNVADYLNSEEILPKPDFNIEWLFGLLFGYSNKQLVYINFTHPKVKAAFCMDYDVEYSSEGADLPAQFERFVKRMKQLTDETDTTNMQWSKLIQVNSDLFLRSKT